MSESTKSADTASLSALRARLAAARASGVRLQNVADKVPCGGPSLFSITNGSRGASPPMVARINAVLDAVERGEVPKAAIAIGGKTTQSPPEVLEALRGRLQFARSTGVTVRKIAEKSELATPNFYHFAKGDVGVSPERAAKINRALDELGIPASARKAPPPARLSYARGHETPKLDRELMKAIADLARDSVMGAQLCTIDQLRHAAHTMTRQGLVTFWSPEGRNTISPERAHAMLKFLVERGARGAKTLLARLDATGLVRTSTPSRAPGIPPRAAPGVTVHARDRLRMALAESFGGDVTALAKFLAMTAGKVTKILGGFSNLNEPDAEKIATRLDTLTKSGGAMVPVAGLRMLAGTAIDDPIASRQAPVMNGAAGAEAARMLARWKDEAFEYFLRLASGHTTQGLNRKGNFSDG